MALSPEDIVNHEFKQALRGYAVQEVDDLLDRLADQLERAERDIADLKQRVVDADARTTEALATESSLKRTLITAQDAAQRTMDDAQVHAETVRADADREATQQVDEAHTRSTAMLEEAEHEASAIRSSYLSEQEAVAARVAELAAIEDRYRTELRALLERQLGKLERLEATGSPGGGEVEELRQAVRRRQLEGMLEEDSDPTPDGGVAEPGGHDGEYDGLVPFGGLTAGNGDDGRVAAEHHGHDGGPHDGRPGPDHDAPT